MLSVALQHVQKFATEEGNSEGKRRGGYGEERKKGLTIERGAGSKEEHTPAICTVGVSELILDH